jgi:hypothetical protein
MLTHRFAAFSMPTWLAAFWAMTFAVHMIEAMPTLAAFPTLMVVFIRWSLCPEKHLHQQSKADGSAD